MSPSSLATFYKDREEYYLSYMADTRPQRFPQTAAMAIGSSFDAYVKSWLHEALFGKGSDPKFEFRAIFEAQVEKQNRDFAMVAGKHAFGEYQACGALVDLLTELQGAVMKPRFEIEIGGIVDGQRESVEATVGGVPLLGKLDIFFISRSGAHVIFDFKVNGYCSRGNKSPMRGYLRLRGRNTHEMHRDCFPMLYNGMQINGAMMLEQSSKEWANQLSIYGWLSGEEVGSEFVTAIDQLACSENVGGPPTVRVAEHRLRISCKYQREWFEMVRHAWEVVCSDHFFRDLPKEESQNRCEVLDKYATALQGSGSDQDKWLQDLVRGQRNRY
jgi:hypothetical protein